VQASIIRLFKQKKKCDISLKRLAINRSMKLNSLLIFNTNFLENLTI